MCSEYSGQVECYIVVKFCGSVKQIFGSYLHQCFGINDDDDGGKNGDEEDQIDDESGGSLEAFGKERQRQLVRRAASVYSWLSPNKAR